MEGQRDVSYIIQVYTSGGTNKEFNLRHDWHSLFSNDEQLEMRHYSTKYFPDADEYVCITCAHRPTESSSLASFMHCNISLVLF